MSFSPAPWVACHDGACQCGLVWSVPADAPIARAFDRNDGEGTKYPREAVRANARLIAKAPLMYELLKVDLAAIMPMAYAYAEAGGAAGPELREFNDFRVRVGSLLASIDGEKP